MMCRDHREVPVDGIIARIGTGYSVKAVVEQLRCHVPGCEAPCRVTIRGRLHEVVLAGPGAYQPVEKASFQPSGSGRMLRASAAD